MNRFFTCLLVFASIFLCEYFYPATVYGQSGYLVQQTDPSSDTKKSEGLFSQTPKQTDVKTPPSTGLFQDQANAIKNNDALMRGMGNDALNEVTPIGSGFWILAALASFYSFIISLFVLRKKVKVNNKSKLAFVILLTASISQACGQPACRS